MNGKIGKVLWQNDAIRIIDELFPVANPQAWDGLLDLRQQLLAGNDWSGVLDLFLICRVRLEMDHYLPFYRLRRLLAASLRLETGVTGLPNASLDKLLQENHRCFSDLKRKLRREFFEHSTGRAVHVSLRIVEQADAKAT